MARNGELEHALLDSANATIVVSSSAQAHAHFLAVECLITLVSLVLPCAHLTVQNLVITVILV